MVDRSCRDEGQGIWIFFEICFTEFTQIKHPVLQMLDWILGYLIIPKRQNLYSIKCELNDYPTNIIWAKTYSIVFHSSAAEFSRTRVLDTVV